MGNPTPRYETRRETVDAERDEDQPGRVEQLRAEDAGQRERADANRQKDRPQHDSRAGEPVLQPSGPPEPRHATHRGAGARDQDEFADEQPVRPLEPADLEPEANQPHRDQQQRHQQHPPRFGGAPLELPHDQDPDRNPGATISDVTRRTGLAQSLVSRITHRMADAGIMRVRPDEKDRRKSRLAIEPSERAMFRTRADGSIASALAAHTPKLSAAQRKELTRHLAEAERLLREGQE